MPIYDFAIIGGGIIGLSTGMALSQRLPRAKILLLEKEKALGSHQTGNNSGVIHSGIYYRPGSLKARFACEGNAHLVAFCKEHGIPHDVCGKVIVATEPGELSLLDQLYRRGLDNGLKVFKIGPDELKDIEPHVAGLAGIRIPQTGIVNYKRVAEAYAGLIRHGGGDVRLDAKVENIGVESSAVTIETATESYRVRFLVNCAGLQSDRIAKLMRTRSGMRIIPIRGEYYELKPDKRHLVNHLIYPVPNPRYPFLGVHFTRTIGGGTHAGPNAVLGFKREGYRKGDFDLRDSFELLTYPAFWKFAAGNWREGSKEMLRSLSKTLFVRSLQRLVPEVQAEDLVPGHAGVRAQGLLRDGQFIDDFLIIRGEKSVHVCNAPSPAATASLPIGRAIVDQICSSGSVDL
jgi:(S)-2-hydroxyglutarate dehydrogenase